MSCSAILPPAAVIVSLGGFVLATGVSIFAISRHFLIKKLSAFGLEYEFKEPIEHQGYPGLKKISYIIIVVGLLIGVLGAIKTNYPNEWPKKFADVCSARLQISEIDDYMIVRINDKDVAAGQYGEAKEWLDIAPFLHQGPNKVETVIENGPYGGCGGTVVIKLNDIDNKEFVWTWKKLENQIPHSMCFAETRTLNL